ncbi:MAG TPA: PEGA domain-containing protein [Pirellulaceae bacterium]|nr:PEGA domain-containing protein [Pirellulaceae bacterium]
MPSNFARLLLIVAIAGSTLCFMSGCVRRRLTVRTAPAGATLYVDDQPIGETPVSTPFTYYGTRKIQLVKDNFETLTVKQTFDLPWYQYPPLDFITENLWPWEIRDERVVDFQLIPQQIVPTERLLENAQQLRDSAGQGAITPGLAPGEANFALPPAAPATLPAPSTTRFPPVETGPEIAPPGRVLP